jgi:hypothetical protein
MMIGLVPAWVCKLRAKISKLADRCLYFGMCLYLVFVFVCHMPRRWNTYLDKWQITGNRLKVKQSQTYPAAFGVSLVPDFHCAFP